MKGLTLVMDKNRNAIAGLLLLVLASALAVIYSSYQSRQHFSALQNAKREAVRLEEEWGRLLLEQSTWASQNRIERLAAKQLRMMPPQARNIVVVGQ
jgi:cell division protein FtsL